MSSRTRKDRVSFRPLAWGKAGLRKSAVRLALTSQQKKEENEEPANGFHGAVKVTRTSRYRMNNPKTMYWKGNILARTISGMVVRAGFGAASVTLFISDFVVGFALIISDLFT
jgi:hypothetical protein